MEKAAFAKINLILDLTGLLPDGYHAISTVMQTVGLCDRVSVDVADCGKIEITCSDRTVPTDSRNTAFKAARLFFEKAGKPYGARIHIEKHIPHEAGLGGGSTDAAAVLRALDEMMPNAVTRDGLFDIALKVGADVPFCLRGGTALCLNKGEVMAPLPFFDAVCVIAKPDVSVSTAGAYAEFDRAENLRHPDVNGFVYHASRGDFRSAFLCASNIFEELTEIGEGVLIKNALNENGAFFSSMTGSGSAYFGLFEDRSSAQAAADSLRRFVPFVTVCDTVNAVNLS